jgi:putative copper resistance protein D
MGFHVTADGAHLLAAGAWLGGLLALGYVLMLAQRVPSEEHTAHAVATLVRFSRMGYAAVAILISSGLINAWLLVGSPERWIATPYGQLLLVKLCRLACMLVLAAQNRFRLVPALASPKGGPLQAQSPLRVLRQNVLGEQILGLAIVVIVGWLGTLPPAFAASQ